MKRAAAIQQVQNGTPGFFGNIMGSKAERIKWRDKTSGQAKEAPVLRHTVVTMSGTAISVSERVPDTFDETKYVSPWKRDQAVFVSLTEIKNVKGSVTGSGTINPLDD